MWQSAEPRNQNLRAWGPKSHHKLHSSSNQPSRLHPATILVMSGEWGRDLFSQERVLSAEKELFLEEVAGGGTAGMGEGEAAVEES
eukprot:3078986-Rhodomonas_salina.1